MRYSWKKACTVALAVAIGTLPMACNPVTDDNRAAVNLALHFGDVAGYFSDVVTATASTTDDLIEVEVESIPKTTDNSADFHTVDIFAYRVSFTRPDGRNEPGVDVPFPLTLPISGEVSPGGSATIQIILVTQEMKVEQPLRGLWFGDGSRIFSQATVEMFGVDRVENAVSASGSLLVVFGDV